MKTNKSIAEQLAGLAVALENIRDNSKSISEATLKLKKLPAKPYFRMKEKW